jgi:hypothetical protein
MRKLKFCVEDVLLGAVKLAGAWSGRKSPPILEEKQVSADDKNILFEDGRGETGWLTCGDCRCIYIFSHFLFDVLNPLNCGVELTH